MATAEPAGLGRSWSFAVIEALGPGSLRSCHKTALAVTPRRRRQNWRRLDPQGPTLWAVRGVGGFEHSSDPQLSCAACQRGCRRSLATFGRPRRRPSPSRSARCARRIDDLGAPSRGRTGTRPHGQRRIFLPTTAFAAAARLRSGSGVRLGPGAMRGRPPPSTLYTFPMQRGLARRCLGPCPGGSPTLTGFTPGVSSPGAQICSSPLCLPISPSGHAAQSTA